MTKNKGDSITGLAYRFIILACFLPPFVGGSLMALAGFYPMPEFYLIFIDIGGIYVLVLLFSGLLMAKKFARWFESILGADRFQAEQKVQTVLAHLPWFTFSAIALYSMGGIYLADITLQRLGYAEYSLDDKLVHQLGIVPVVLISSFPLFFYFVDRLGKYVIPHDVCVNAVPIKNKVMMLGIVTPLLVDCFLLGYFYNKTGYFGIETVIIWLTLLLLAVGGTGLAWNSFQQGIIPLKNLTQVNSQIGSPPVRIKPRTLDEFGVLAKKFDELTTQLTEERDFAKSIVETAPMIIIELDEKGVIQKTNSWFTQLLGFTEEDAIGQEWGFLFASLETKSKAREAFEKACSQQHMNSLVIPVVNKEKHLVPIAWYSEMLEDTGAGHTSLICIGQNISEQTKAWTALRESEKNIRNILEAAVDSIILIDDSGIIQDVNPATLELFQYTKDELLGKKISILMPEPYHSDHAQYIKDYLNTGKKKMIGLGREVNAIKKDQTVFPIELTVSETRRDSRSFFTGVVRDISERKQKDETLQASKERLNRAQDIARIGSWELDLKTNQLFWTDQIFKLFEIDQSKFPATYEAFIEAIHQEDRDRVNEAYSISLETKEPYRITHRLLMKDGRVKWVEERCNTEFDENDEPLVSRGTVQDVTDLYLAQKAVKNSEARYRRAEKGTNDGLWEWNIKTGHDYFSPRWFEILGYKPQELPYHVDTFSSLVHPADMERVKSALEMHFSEDIPYDVEMRLKQKNGEYRWIQSRGQVQFDSEGKPEIMTGFITDIERRKKAEEGVTRLASIVHNSSDFIGIADIQGNALFLNSSGRQLVGIESDQEFNSKTVIDFFADEDKPQVNNEIIPTVLSQGRWSGEFYFQHFKNKNRILMWFDIFRVDDDKGRPIAMATVSQELTQRKASQLELENYRDHLEELVEQRTAELKNAQENAEKASAAKTEFLSRMSHELRTPLNAILGFGQLLQQSEASPLDGDQLDSLEEIMRAGRHLLGLVNEVLDLSRIESGRLDIRLDEVSLRDIVEDCIKQCEPMAKERENIIVYERDEHHYMVMGDPFRLRQVVMNILSNAIKYNRQQGTVNIFFEKQPESLVKLSIQDEGGGIPSEYHEAIFKPFERLVNLDSGIEGTGVGLAISKKLIEAMNGVIGVDSQEGEGSTFWIQLSS
ncbi:PAS domain S-box protein [Aliikangiella sp. G2MR2-5]|uniref:PAS domain S-box protein n=1 Tax=Aliikangiella sp. G2MR2-5 TaxID=2788943 RepID=UPI0018A8AEF9|nr:PAS domain S-box protein [Aliikangiella sp. G2MR2-5]